MDTDILETLYRRYHRPALLYTTALCGNEHLAEDIVADAFVKAYISLPEECPSFQYWLFRVCKNLWFDYLRKHRHLSGPEALEYLSDPDTPETLHLTNQRQQALWHAIRSLPPLDRELITAHYFSGLPLREAARLLGKSYTAVRQRIRRLRLILKQRMEEQGYDD